MAKEQFAKPVSEMKRRKAVGESTRFGEIRNFVNPAELITSENDFSMAVVPSLVVVFADTLVGALDVAKYVKNYHAKFGKYPRILCLEGISSCKWIQWNKPLNLWMKDVLIRCGIPAETVETLNGADTISELKIFMNKKHYKHASVFTARCFCLSAAIQLKRMIPFGEFKFFEKGFVSEEVAHVTNVVPTLHPIFDMDDLDGLGLDMLLGEIIRLNMLKSEILQIISTTLPRDAVKNIEEAFNGTKTYWEVKEYVPIVDKVLPVGELCGYIDVLKGLMPIETVKKYVEKGYILGLSTKADRSAVGLTEEQFFEMLPKRLSDFPWLKDQETHLNKQIDELLSFIR